MQVISERASVRKKLAPLPRNRRADTPPGMRFTEDDAALLVAIWRHEGVVTVDQLAQILAREKRRVQHRLTLLYHNHYIARVDDENKNHALRRGVFWLADKGAKIVSVRLGGEGDLKDFPHRKSPRWDQLDHTLRLNDVRLKMMADAQEIRQAEVREWISDYEFSQWPDVVVYETQLRKGRERILANEKREVRPDGYCYITIPAYDEKFYHYRFLIEVDMATETRRGQFGRDKILPLTAYLESEGGFQKQFGKSGLILVVTTDSTRLANIKRQAEQFGGKGYFYFTTFEQVSSANILLAPIWQQSGESGLRSLIILN